MSNGPGGSYAELERNSVDPWGLTLTGLYDGQGILRFAGRDTIDCLAYAELFDLDQAEYCIEPLSLISAPCKDEGLLMATLSGA